MMYRTFLGIVALITTISILTGCAPKPQIEIYMEPVAGREHAQIDAQKDSISVEHRATFKLRLNHSMKWNCLN